MTITLYKYLLGFCPTKNVFVGTSAERASVKFFTYIKKFTSKVHKHVCT